MKIAYFAPGPLSATSLGPEELDRRREYLERYAFPGTEIDVQEAAGGPTSLESAWEEVRAVPEIVRGVKERALAGADAVIIGSFDDPGLDAARELVRIPVVGPAQASCHLAAQLGDRFGILTVVDEVIPLLSRLLRAYGLMDLLAEIRAVHVPVLELRRQPETVLENLTREGAALLAAGADTVILGGMTIGFLGVAPRLQERLDVPVVDPVLASLKMAETLVSLSAVHSSRAYPPPRKEADAREPATTR
ncbi:MAG: aspartate/glutamate racemase family protein [Gemmatimonadota bacterium]